MGEREFHDPDFSWGVFRRRIGDELLHLVTVYAEVLATRGLSLTWNESFPNRRQYHSAVYRLRKQGLIAESGGLHRKPALILTEKGEQRISPEMRPQRFWRKRWGGTWYLLMYDVPESQRKYRNALRGFLRRLRMGRLQKSVWVSHRDIRPEYADLQEAAAVGEYAVLMEAQTLLGMEPWRICEAAWPFERIEQAQAAYCEYAERKLSDLSCTGAGVADVESLAREELQAYREAMREDPLLPTELHPPCYNGQKVLDLHCRLIATIGERL
jgi:phenylacetic acid degradation operon negative regulatory protein